MLDKLPRRRQPLLAAVAYAPTGAEAEQARLRAGAWCRKRGHTAAVETLEPGRDGW